MGQGCVPNEPGMFAPVLCDCVDDDGREREGVVSADEIKRISMVNVVPDGNKTSCNEK